MSYVRQRANLDILRSFAVACVAIQHLADTLHFRCNWGPEMFMEFTSQMGRAGVLAFFVHTSLVLMHSLERIKGKTSEVAVRFYVRRFFRIYPLSAFAIVMMLLLRMPKNAYGAVWTGYSTIQIVSNLLLVQNFFSKTNILDPLWTLPYEVQMYIVLPFFFLVARNRHGIKRIIGFLVLFSLAAEGLWRRSPGHIGLAEFVPCFLCGVLCYALEKRQGALMPAWVWPGYVMMLITIYCLIHMHKLPVYWVGWLFCLALGVAINLFHDSKWKAGNFVTSHVALYSYGIYILHDPVLYLIFAYLGVKNPVGGTVLFILLTLLASMATYYIFERWLIDLGRRLSSEAL
ncbi:MAG: acyltransferase [Negativicutes bacterium]|nr:acyltransferase [Negativicutes bacterium]